MRYFITLPLISATVLVSACSGIQYNYLNNYPAMTAAKTPFDAAPREGWATDGRLSYQLYSYYPVNYYNNGIIGHYGYQGLYYH